MMIDVVSSIFVILGLFFFIVGAIALFVIGLHTVVTHSNLIKRVMGTP